MHSPESFIIEMELASLSVVERDVLDSLVQVFHITGMHRDAATKLVLITLGDPETKKSLYTTEQVATALDILLERNILEVTKPGDKEILSVVPRYFKYIERKSGL